MLTTPVPLDMAALIFNSLAEPLLILDPELRAVMANRAFYETMNIAPGTLAGKAVDEIIDDAPRIRNTLEGFADNKRNVKKLEIVCKTPAGRKRVFSVIAHRLSQELDPPEALLLQFRDITEEKAADQRIGEANRTLERNGVELELTNQELSSFSHIISHDLRTPLRLMSRIAHLLLSDHGASLPPDAVELVNMILSSTDEMGKLIENLLRFSQITREPMKKRRVDMQRLVRESMEDLDEERRGRDVEIAVDELAPCQGDHALLKQLFLNLIENALKFTSECQSAKIHVGCAQTGGECVYFIRDNGVGFDTKESESMFIVFRRLSRSNKIAGSGIGLAIAKRIVERHGGRIWADGEPGRGATFHFTIGKKPDALHSSIERT